MQAKIDERKKPAPYQNDAYEDHNQASPYKGMDYFKSVSVIRKDRSDEKD